MVWQALLIQGAIWGTGWALNRWVLPKPKSAEPPLPQGLEHSQSTIGVPIPYVYGTARVDNLVLAWHGNHSVFEYPSQPGTFVYRLDMFLVIGMPPWYGDGSPPYSGWANLNEPRLMRFYYGDQPCPVGAHSGPTRFDCKHGQYVSIRKSLGGRNKGGDYKAEVEFFDGRDNQELTSYPLNGITDPTLTTRLDQCLIAGNAVDRSMFPGFRNMMTIAVCMTSTGPHGQRTPYHPDGADPDYVPSGSSGAGTVGESSRVAAIGVEVSAAGPQWISPGYDANPAWVIYDIMRAPIWKIGYDPTLIDYNSFEEAATTLEVEQHGCSGVVYTASEAEEVIRGLLSQIDGVLFENPATGKLTLRLIRADYDPEEIPEITVDNTVGMPTVTMSGWRDIPNQVRVTFSNRDKDYKQDSVTAQRLGNAAAQDNRIRSFDADYPWCTTATLASKLAARDLAVVGRPRTSIEIALSRAFHDLLPGDVVMVNLPPTGVVNQPFRVLEIDRGQLARGEILTKLVNDAFDVTSGAFPVPDPPGPPVIPGYTDLIPFTRRVFDETPLWVQGQQFLGGLIGLDASPFIHALIADEPLGIQGQYVERTRDGLTDGTYSDLRPYSDDVYLRNVVNTATLADSYARTAEPYDTTASITIEDVYSDTDYPFSLVPNEDDEETTATDLQLSQGNMMLRIGDELMSVATIRNLGDGQYDLGGIWRGLLDTVPVDHDAGTRVWFLWRSLDGLFDLSLFGRKAQILEHYVMGNALPKNGTSFGIGSGDEADDELIMQGRNARKLRATDMRVKGYELAGTKGIPAVNETLPLLGDFKEVSSLDGCADLVARYNVTSGVAIQRGDTSHAISESADERWDVYSQKVGDDEIALTTDLTEPEASGLLLGKSGHGAIDLILHTRSNSTGDRSWQSPRIRFAAGHYRNLLANPSAEYGTLSPGWTNMSGASPTVTTGTGSLSQDTSGTYFTFTAAGKIGQTVDVHGYKARGLAALVSWYQRDTATTSIPEGEEPVVDDGVPLTVRIDALDADGDVIGSATASDPQVSPDDDNWYRYELERVNLPAGTAKVRVSVEGTVTGGGGTSRVARVQLQIGQYSAELFAEPSWENVVNSFVITTSGGCAARVGELFPGACAQGGAFSASELAASLNAGENLPGYEYGDAVLTFARCNKLLSDTGNVILEALDTDENVITSVETGAEVMPIANTWYRRRLVLTIPDGTANLRVRLVATRTLGSGLSGAAFDDFNLRVFKQLDPVTEYDFDFSYPAVQSLPSSWQLFHLAWPELPIPTVWANGVTTPGAIGAQTLTGPTAAWSDAPVSHTAGRMTGYFTLVPNQLRPGEEHPTMTPWVPCLTFYRASAGSSIDVQIGGDDTTTGEEYGEFASDTPFTVAVYFRTREDSFATACGLIGRRDETGVGWGLGIDATGHVRATLQGEGGTKTATRPSTTVIDKANHWAVIVYDPDAETLTVYDEHGGTSVSTSSGLGEFAVEDIAMRIGRDAAASACGDVDIGVAYLFYEALTSDQVGQLFGGGDPSGLVTTWTSNRALWTAGPDDENGNATMVRHASSVTPVAYEATIGRYGLAVTGANTNKIPACFEDSSWTAEGTATKTTAIVDPTGMPRGVRLTDGVGDQALVCSPITMGSATHVTVVFWARSISGGTTLACSIRNSSDVVKGTANVTLTSLWQRFVVDLGGGWDNSTPTGKLAFDLSAAGVFDLGHVMWLGHASASGAAVEPPFAIQDAGLSLSATHAVHSESLPMQLGYEGELLAEGLHAVALHASGHAATSGPLAGVDDVADSNDRRALFVNGTNARVYAYDDVGSGQIATSDAQDFDEPFSLRGRWNRTGLPEDGDHLGVVADDAVDSSAYSSFEFDVGDSLSAIRIGGGGPGSDVSPNVLLSRIRVSTREPKLE